MLSFAPNIKLEMEMKRLQGLFIESYNSLEGISSEEERYLNRFALISNIGASPWRLFRRDSVRSEFISGGDNEHETSCKPSERSNPYLNLP